MTDRRKSPIFPLTKRGFLAGSVAAASVLASPSILRAQGRRGWDRPIIAALNAREGDPTDISIRRIPEILAEQYDIDITIEIYPSSQLAADIGQLEGVQNGLWDIASNATAAFFGFTRAFHFMDLPFLYPTWDDALEAVRSDFMLERFAAAEAEMPLKILPIVGAGGYRLLSNKLREVRIPSDMAGIKFRSSFGGSVVDQNTITAWGGVPVPLGWSESYTGAQQGIIEGMFVQPIWTYIARFHEIMGHATRVPSNWVGQLQVMHHQTWADMPDDIKGPFMEAAQMAADEGNALDRALEDDFVAQLNDNGMTVYEPNADEMAEWRELALATWGDSGVDAELIARLQG
ncbi:MAG: TRAP transporter substrate-binding protein [Pararhodobacter sp.]|nr:TRAP transporter substrate-binding protein [Pararhodobacter sp.]